MGEVRFEQVNESGSDPIDGFGLSRYDEGFSSTVGEGSSIDYGRCDVVCKANSVNGIFEFAAPLNKYSRVEVDIVNSSLSNTGLPHQVVEDTFEWVNSGAPAHLAQTMHSNIANMGIALERSNPGLIETNSPLHQGKFIVPRDNSWYDWFNSTVDFEIVNEMGEEGYELPYANTVLFVERLGQVLVGGQGYLLSIDITDFSIRRVSVDSRSSIFIKDLFLFNNKVYILDDASLYIWDLDTGNVEKDNGLGLPNRLHKIVVLINGILVIGGEDGIYARRSTQDEWQKVAETIAPVTAMILPDSAFAVAGNEFWYSSEGFTWTKIGSYEGTVNSLVKHRSQILVGTDGGVFGDNGQLYSGRVTLALLNILSDPSLSSDVTVNAVASNFSKAVFGLSDGRYIVYEDSFEVNEDSYLETIHKSIIVNDSIWLFGYDLFKIVGQEKIRRLASGSPIGQED